MPSENKTSVLQADLVFRVGTSPVEDITYFASLLGDEFPVFIHETYEMGGVWYALVEAYFGKPFVSHPARHNPAIRTEYATLPFSQITYGKTDPLELAAYQAALFAAEQPDNFSESLATFEAETERMKLQLNHKDWDFYAEPPDPEAEAQASEISDINGKWLDVENQPEVRTISELEAEHADWLDEQATRESNRP